MKLFLYTATIVALLGSTAAAATLPEDTELHVELARAPESESVSSFTKRTINEGTLARSANPGLRDLLARAAPDEEVGALMKRGCPDAGKCCGAGKFQVSLTRG